jgi:hypothetical protein
MARSSSDIDAIIAGLKANRDTRDAAIETAAAALDGSNDKKAANFRSLKHVKEIANDKEVCISCNLKTDDAGDPIGMTHHTYYIEDITLGSDDISGLTTRLADESFTVTGATTVENL